MTINLKKCPFFSKTTDCLGRIIVHDKLHVATRITEAIKALQYPTTLAKLWSFLKLGSVYQRFAPSFPKLAAQLNQNLKKGEPLQFYLNKERMKAVDILKD